MPPPTSRDKLVAAALVGAAVKPEREQGQGAGVLVLNVGVQQRPAGGVGVGWAREGAGGAGGKATRGPGALQRAA